MIQSKLIPWKLRSLNSRQSPLLLPLFVIFWTCQAPPAINQDDNGPPAEGPPLTVNRNADTAPTLEIIPSGDLGIDDELQASIHAGQVHRYEIYLQAGNYLHIEVEQQGVDLVLQINQEGKPGRRFDSPNGAYGSEHLFFLAVVEGPHRLDIQAARGTGSYRIAPPIRRSPTAADRTALAASEAYTQGRQQTDTAAALKSYETAHTLWGQLDMPILQATALLRIGQEHYHNDQRQLAVRSYQEALALLRDQPTAVSQQVVTLQALGQTLRRGAEYSAALATYQEALQSVRQLGDRFEEAHALNNTALVLDLQGRMGEALSMYREALNSYRATTSRSRLASTLTNMAFSHILAGQLPEAREALSEALQLREQEADSYGVALIRAHLGWIAYREGDVKTALSEYERAIALSRVVEERHGLNPLRIVASAWDRKGTALRSIGRPREARAAYDKAREIFAELGDHLFVAHVEANLGWLDLEDGQAERAWNRFELARGPFERSGERHGQASVLYLGATIKRQLGRLTEAKLLLEQVLAIVESNRRVSPNPAVRIAYLGSRYDYYESYIDLLMEQHSMDPEAGHAVTALAAVERSRARSLLEHVTTIGADLRRDVEVELLTEEAELRDLINAKEIERLEKPSLDVERQIEELSRRYRRFQENIRIANPVYAEITQARPLGLPAIQHQLLDADSLLLVYSLGRKRSFLWAITSSKMSVHVLPPANEIERLALRLHRRLSSSNRSTARLQAELSAAELSAKVLVPVATELGSRRLLVMPDGALHLVPFAVLPIPGGKTPLVADHEITYVPSASAIWAMRQEAAARPVPEKFIAILADPVYEPADPRVREIAKPGPSHPGTFKRLIHSRYEAEEIMSLLTEADEVFTAFGLAAQRELVANGDLGDFRYLHFAAHGIFDVAHPERSGLLLSVFDEAGRPVDGMLQAQDLYRLRLSADLAVLSGCETALGPIVRGEGIVGFARGFMYAGIPRVLVSLWKVSDEGTAELMRRFYEAHLRHGLPPPQALQKAQQSMSSDPRWREPYYWAAFVIQGDWR